MKRSLLFKLMLCYIITISLIIMGAYTIGLNIFKDYLTNNFYLQLQKTSKNIVADPIISNCFDVNDAEEKKSTEDSANSSFSTINSYLKSLKQATDFNIWLLDSSGNFLYSTDDIGKKNIYDYNKRFFYLNDHLYCIKSFH